MNPNMIKKLQNMQREMVKAQEELEASTFYGSAGGKMVNVEFTGDKRMRNVTINPELLDPEDAELLQDTIIAAVNDCIKKIDSETASTMSQFTGGGMPGLF